MKIFKKECSPEDLLDTSLPYTCYVVSYHDTADGQDKSDLVISGKQVEIFDYYWDLYRENFIDMKQSNGRVNPKLWTDPNVPLPKKTKTR